MLLALLALSLATVLAVSGAAKLLDLPASALTLRGFGVPEPLRRATALGLALVELAIAAALVPAATARAAAVAAAGLFAAFAIVVAATLVRGRRPDCGCFGRLHSRPLSGITLARTAAFAATAGVVAVADA